MSESSEQNACDDILPEEAFALLGNEIRIDIIWALSKTPDESLSFSELRSRIDVPDSGQFNYHLTELLGSFVRRDEGEYELTFAGTQVVGAIFSGSFNQRGAPLTVELDSTCAICESVLLVEYERECVTISCPACDDLIASFGFPPGAFENRTTDDLARTFNTWIRSLLTATVNGFCLICAGRMRGSIIDNSEHFAD
jgi:DNA-binding HxlR family transcriptional regulator